MIDEAGSEFGGTIRRPRLEQVLEGSGKRRLTALVAPAGFGKTTLISQWSTGHRVVWHTIAEGTTGLPTTARLVLDELRLFVPEISADIVMAVEALPGPDSHDSARHRADALATAICHDLETHLNRDLFLVLDDLHLLDDDPATIRFVAAISRAAPPSFHLITASRTPVPFQIARMKVENQAAVVTADELAFTPDEIRDLIGREHPHETAEQIHRRTGGWSVAVALAVRSDLDSNSRPGEAALGSGPTREGALFDYLAEEVLGSEDPALREALVTAAYLPWIDTDLAEVLELPGSQSLLGSDRGSIYLTRTPGARGREVSPLVREFVRDRHPLQPTARRELMSVAARWYLAQGAHQEALVCATSEPGGGLVEQVLEIGGDELLRQGLARQVLESIKFLPRERRTGVLLLEAEARQMIGDWEGATACYEALAPSSDSIPPGLAWRLGFLHHMRGNLARALEIYQSGMQTEGSDHDQAALLGWAASAHWVRGERDQAKQLAEAALVLANKANDSRPLATAHTVLAMVAALDGERSANDRHYLRALHHAERARDVTQTIRIRCNRGSHFLEEGEFDEALAELDIALRLADLTGFELWRAMSLANRAQVLFYRGNLEEALADLRQARAIFRSLGSSLEAYPLAHIGDIYAARGHVALARTAYEEAVRMAEGPSDLQALVPALSGLARLIAGEDADEAERLAQRAAAVPSVVSHVRALIACAHVALTKGDRARAREIAESAAAIARSRRDLPGLAEAHEVLAAAALDQAQRIAHLDDAIRLWTELSAPLFKARAELDRALIGGDIVARDRAHEVLMRLGSTAWVANVGGPGDAPAVSIHTLGGLTVSIDGNQVPQDAWQSRVARAVLGMLVANRGRPIHREVVMDRLWPDDDPGKAGNRLSVALSTIRTVLDPDRKYPAGHFVTSGDAAVALDLEHVSVDVEVFLDRAHRGRSAVRRGDPDAGIALLRAAEVLYQGEFLEEHPYWDWAAGLREEALSTYLESLALLAEAESGAGDPDAAARRYLRILERDPYHEPAHLALITTMSDTGRHGTARRLYGSYVERMGELGIEPAPFPEPRRS